MRTRAALAVGLTAGLLLSPPALAHTGEAEALSGMLDVPAGGTETLVIAAIAPSDTLEWTWSSSAANLSSVLFWWDAAGTEHEVDTSGLAYGRFVAPGNLAGARLEWTNHGPAPAHVTWSYLCSANFWSQPTLILAASVPLIFLGGALAGGRWFDARAKRMDRRKE